MVLITPEQANALVRDLYGLQVTADSLPGEYDLNFHLTTEGDEQFVLKVVHPSRSRDEIVLQCQALLHITQHTPSLHLPRVQPTPSGETITSITMSDGETRMIWLLSYLPGKVMAKVNPHTPELLTILGQMLGQVTAALADFQHPAAKRQLKWDLAQAAWIADYLDYIEDDNRRALVTHFLDSFRSEVLPALEQTRRSVIHGDANDYNIIVDSAGSDSPPVVSLIDFGDLIESYRVADVAVACAYALLDKPDPLTAAVQVVAGYHQTSPLTEAEIALIFPLICTRLSVSVTNSAYRKTQEDDPYIIISERPAWEALEKLATIHPRLAHYRFRAACGLSPVPSNHSVIEWLQTQSFAPVVDIDLTDTSCHVLDLSVGSLMLGANPHSATCAPMTRLIDDTLAAADAVVGIGRYNEARLIYQDDAFATGDNPIDERRTIHLGLDLFMAAQTVIYAPLAGTVAVVANNTGHLDYGPLIILRHETDQGAVFYTLYGHLAEDVLMLTVGQSVAAGEAIARIGSPPINGDWPPHLHFQIILDLLERARDFPGVAFASQRDVWLSLSPDPNLILRVPPEIFPIEPTYEETLAGRKTLLGGNLSLSYHQPIKMVRGWRQYLYDATGRAYLDMYNNVPHVGHTHPHVVNAIQAQTALLTTNTRYLHDNILRYAERLTSLLPEPLRVAYIVNSASEANELALRLARAFTGHENLIVMDTAYHGHTTTLIDISPYKFNGPGGQGKKSWVHIAPVPDDFRGIYKRDDPQRGHRYAAHVGEIIADITAQGQGLSGFIAESLPSVGGQIIPPPGYLAEVYRQVRAAGGLCIADEVQVGFGRLGETFWGFELQDVMPDIVVLGKPIGNGYPIGAVVTTPEIANAFDNGMEFFSTFGGNPVACAAGLAVLDVLEKEGLQANARTVGAFLCDGLRDLMGRFHIIGDVRGIGFFLGIELIDDAETLAPAAQQASYVVNRLRDQGILAGTDGPLHNVIKLRPSMIFSRDEAAFFLKTLIPILAEDGAQPKTK